ncbi:MAG TPA: DinB family protein [Actinocrinis sp.]|nr:DinB family protein [Actinocrinis sp.]
MAGTPTPLHFSERWPDDRRVAPRDVGDERQVLTSVLDWHRKTLEVKCAGVPGERLAERSVPPSTLSLHGLVRHLAGVERWWFQVQFAGEDVPLLYYTDEQPDLDFDFAETGADPAEDLEVWRAECRKSRAIVAAAPSLDATGIRKRTGEPISLRKILVDMIAEYARHSGHADLLRERIDGVTGH